MLFFKNIIFIILLNLSLYSIDVTDFPKSMYGYNWNSPGYDFDNRNSFNVNYASCDRYAYKFASADGWFKFKSTWINNQLFCTKDSTVPALDFSEVSSNGEYNYNFQYFQYRLNSYTFLILMNSDQNFSPPQNYQDFLQLNPLKIFYRTFNVEKTKTRIELIDIDGKLKQTEIDSNTFQIISVKNYTPDFVISSADENVNENQSISELENIPFDFSCSFDKNSPQVKSFNLQNSYELYNQTVITVIDTGDGYYVKKEYPQPSNLNGGNIFINCKNGKPLEYIIYDAENEQQSLFQTRTYRNETSTFTQDVKISTDKSYKFSRYIDLTNSTKSYATLTLNKEKIEFDETLLESIQWKDSIETDSFLNIFSGIVQKKMCDDQAPANQNNSCDRTCEDVGYITQNDNTCLKELDCESLVNDCISKCITQTNIANFECSSTDFNSQNTICECANDNLNDPNIPNQYPDAPEPGSGTGGNSLTDNMKNLAISVNDNTDASNYNTDALKEQTGKIIDNSDALKENTSVLDKISSFLSTITDLMTNTSTISDLLNETIYDVANKYSRQFFDDTSCLKIQPVQISMYGKTITFLSQDFIDSFFPVSLFRGFVIFAFVFNATMSFFRGDN